VFGDGAATIWGGNSGPVPGVVGGSNMLGDGSSMVGGGRSMVGDNRSSSVGESALKILFSAEDYGKDAGLLEEVNRSRGGEALIQNASDFMRGVAKLDKNDTDAFYGDVSYYVAETSGWGDRTTGWSGDGLVSRFLGRAAGDLVQQGINLALKRFNIALDNSRIGLVCSATTNFTVGAGIRKAETARLKAVRMEVDVCTLADDACLGNLGYPRKEMPQLDEGETRGFVETARRGHLRVRGRYGLGWRALGRKVGVRLGTILPRNTVAVQREINAYKVVGMANAWAMDPTNNFMTRTPCVVARHKVKLESGQTVWVHHILDGHHRMYTLKVVAPETPVRAYIIDARPLEALEWMRDYMEYGAPGAAYEEM